MFDNIFTNDLEKYKKMSGAFICDISDHYSLFHITKSSMENCDPHNPEKRQFNNISIIRLFLIIDP